MFQPAKLRIKFVIGLTFPPKVWNFQKYSLQASAKHSFFWTFARMNRWVHLLMGALLSVAGLLVASCGDGSRSVSKDISEEGTGRRAGWIYHVSLNLQKLPIPSAIFRVFAICSSLLKSFNKQCECILWKHLTSFFFCPFSFYFVILHCEYKNVVPLHHLSVIMIKTIWIWKDYWFFLFPCWWLPLAHWQ